MDRRQFLVGCAGGAGAVSLMPAIGRPAPGGGGEEWESVRASFSLDPDKAHFAGFFLASHPKPVREAIERYRRLLDEDPIGCWEEHRGECERRVLAAAGEYLGADGPAEVALTDSTTMGLGLVYNGLRLAPGDEVLSTTHDHYATRAALAFGARRNGATVRTVELYRDGSAASVDGVVGPLVAAVNARTRAVAVTWVHSSSGVRLPIAAIADALAAINARRDDAERVLLCVDGVHGLGIVDTTMPALGCDFFIAGTHKWMFGPRGTGLVWGRPAAWARVHPTIPPFGAHEPPGMLHTPGGFHSFEHRWAVDEAFRFHLAIGKPRVQARILALNRRIKEGLAAMRHVALHTPMDDDLSAGIVCFDVDGRRPGEVVARLAERAIVASESPYTPSCARLAGSLLVNEAHVDRAIAAVGELR